MAPFGKIYTYANNIRIDGAMVLADMNGLEIEFPPFVYQKTNKTPEFLAKFPLGKLPAFEDADGFHLTESLAIATYLARSGPKADQLLGTDAKTQALIMQWVQFSDGELFNNLAWPIAMLIRKTTPFDKNHFDKSIVGTKRAVKYLEGYLQDGKKYLVGDSFTIADVMVTSYLYPLFKYYFDAEWRKEIPNIVAYFQVSAELPVHKKRYGEPQMCETRLHY
ncbi:glutathione S-transferase [Xylaria nigripes]|nr:glutathione S-transferase [Xylaria nigripes]